MVSFNEQRSFVATMSLEGSLGGIGFSAYPSDVSPPAPHTGGRLTAATTIHRNIQYLFLFRDDIRCYEIKFLSDSGSMYCNLISEKKFDDPNDALIKSAIRREGSDRNDDMGGWDLFWSDPALGTGGPMSNSRLSVSGALRLGVNKPISISSDFRTFLALEKKTFIGDEWVASFRSCSIPNAIEPAPSSFRLNVLQLGFLFKG